MTVDEETRKCIRHWRSMCRDLWTTANDPGGAPRNVRDRRAADWIQRTRDEAARRCTTDARELARRGSVHSHAGDRAGDLKRATANVCRVFAENAAEVVQWPDGVVPPRVSAAQRMVPVPREPRVATRAADATARQGGPVVVDERYMRDMAKLYNTLPEEAEPSGGGATRATGDDGHRDGDDAPTTTEARGDREDPFAEINAEEFARLSQQWSVADEADRGRPPLNPEQRAAYRPMVTYVKEFYIWVRDMQANPTECRRRPTGPLIMVHAAPGCGKSCALTVLCEWVEEHTGGLLKLDTCAMSGSAASLLPRGQTVFTLLGLKNLPEAASFNTVRPLGSALRAADEQRVQSHFNPRVGVDAQGWTGAGLAFDEMSQCHLAMLAHVDSRLREAAEPNMRDLPFGKSCAKLFIC